ncbi:MAG: hypothetical protein ABR498_04175, partial [Candidatus Dormibacteria bacterium]
AGLPTVPVFQMQFQPGNADMLYVATFGRGVYRYNFAGLAANTPEFPGALAGGAALLILGTAWFLRRRHRSAIVPLGD